MTDRDDLDIASTLTRVKRALKEKSQHRSLWVTWKDNYHREFEWDNWGQMAKALTRWETLQDYHQNSPLTGPAVKEAVVSTPGLWLWSQRLDASGRVRKVRVILGDDMSRRWEP
jgi:hypothetical protein